MFSSLQNYVLRGVKLCISFVNILVEGVEGEKQCPFHPLCTMNQRIGYPLEGVEREIPITLGLYNIGTQKHGVTESWTENYIYSLCLCVSVFIKLQSKQILIGLEELAVLFITTRRFPMKKTAVYEMKLDVLPIVHQRFDFMLSTLW